jgi:hypothetical protein
MQKSNSLKIGDVFRCKRRGHEIIVSAIVQQDNIPNRVWYRNIRGSVVSLKAARLLSSRFERMPVEALKSSKADTPAETVAALAQNAA